MLRQAAIFFLLFGTTHALNTIGQLSGSVGRSRQYPGYDEEITEFSADFTLQGFTLENGKLKVEMNGDYYIYAQVFFDEYDNAPFSHNRVALTVNGNRFSLMQSSRKEGTDYGSEFTGGIAHLQKGDLIGLKTVYPSSLWVKKAHTFFGAYKIGQQ